MTAKTCPHCGYDLEQLNRFETGHLVIEGNVAVYWKGYRLKLPPQERLFLIALARANGGLVPDHAAAEIIGYEGDKFKIIDVVLCRLRGKFKEVDPSFDSLERDGNAGHARGTRWRAEAYIIPELIKAAKVQRALHKLMLEYPGRSLMEWATLQGRKSHSSMYCALRALERRKLVYREKHYQRGWTALGSLAMHTEIELTKGG